MANMSEPEIAWAAGLFEGEGCILHGRKPSRRWSTRGLSVTSTDLDVLERFQTVMACGKIRREAHLKHLSYKPQWHWTLNAWPDVERCLRLLLPHLGMRRREKALALLADPAKPHVYRGLGPTAKQLALEQGISLRTAYRRLYAEEVA